MKALINWVQYLYHISGYPNIVDLNKVMFIQKLDTYMYRAENRKKIINQSNTNTKEASLIPLDIENKWKECESNSINYFYKIIGVNVVPIPYVVQEKINPDVNGDLPRFIFKMISFAPLKYDNYESDRHTVHQELVSLRTGKPPEDCLKNTLGYRYGMISMKYSRNQFVG